MPPEENARTEVREPIDIAALSRTGPEDGALCVFTGVVRNHNEGKSVLYLEYEGYEEMVEAIEGHRFAPVRKLMWRNSDLDFGTAERLIRSLEAPTSDEWLSRARDADDVVALKTLSALPEVQERLTGPKRVQLLWDVCRIPDFRSASESEHAHLLTRIFEFLCGRGIGGQKCE